MKRLPIFMACSLWSALAAAETRSIESFPAEDRLFLYRSILFPAVVGFSLLLSLVSGLAARRASSTSSWKRRLAVGGMVIVFLLFMFQMMAAVGLLGFEQGYLPFLFYQAIALLSAMLALGMCRHLLRHLGEWSGGKKW